jgi:hypothetical protein
MKPMPARIADLWWRVMHTAPMWPSHGQYECRTCGRHHRVCWEQAPPAEVRVKAMPFGTRAHKTLFDADNLVDPLFCSGNNRESRRPGSRKRR